MTESNKLCADEGMIDLRDETECRDVVSWLQNFISGVTFRSAVTWPGYPKGCFLYVNNVWLFWNTHPTGARSVNERNVCKPGTLL